MTLKWTQHIIAFGVNIGENTLKKQVVEDRSRNILNPSPKRTFNYQRNAGK
jgi:hypothetical protein